MPEPVGNDVEYAEEETLVVPGTSEAPARRGAWSLKVGVLFAFSLLLVAVAALSVSSSAPAARGSEHAPREADPIGKFGLDDMGDVVGDLLSDAKDRATGNPEVVNVLGDVKDRAAGSPQGSPEDTVEQASAAAKSALANALAWSQEELEAVGNATNASGLLDGVQDSLEAAVNVAGAVVSGAVPIAQQGLDYFGNATNMSDLFDDLDAMINSTKDVIAADSTNDVIAAGVTAVDAAQEALVSADNGTTTTTS